MNTSTLLAISWYESKQDTNVFYFSICIKQIVHFAELDPSCLNNYNKITALSLERIFASERMKWHVVFNDK